MLYCIVHSVTCNHGDRCRRRRSRKYRAGDRSPPAPLDLIPLHVPRSRAAPHVRSLTGGAGVPSCPRRWGRRGELLVGVHGSGVSVSSVLLRVGIGIGIGIGPSAHAYINVRMCLYPLQPLLAVACCLFACFKVEAFHFVCLFLFVFLSPPVYFL